MANNDIPVTKTAVVEDNITHQAGEGLTANHAQSTETPDIFDNSAQPAVKQVTETVPAEAVALKNANTNVSLADVATQGATVTTPSANINPNGVVENVDSVPQSNTSSNDTKIVPQAVVVEDSITHQAGEGITAGMSSSLETPDIFVNTPQPAIKAVAQEVPVDTLDSSTVVSDTIPQTVQGAHPIVTNLETLSDGSVDIPRE